MEFRLIEHSARLIRDSRHENRLSSFNDIRIPGDLNRPKLVKFGNENVKREKPQTKRSVKGKF